MSRANNPNPRIMNEGETEFMAPSAPAEPINRQGFGCYRLLQVIGSGGMGEVWLAEQRHPVRRRVALKLIKAGMDTREVVARFESERQALALMDHPLIAKIFDAGSTPEGRPYFAMEYVDGIAITAYCDQHKLSSRSRLELFVRVCEGVQHAHQKAIIHRDLKPSNILVTEVDGKPEPKIIDFGIAKAVAQPLTLGTLLTQAGAMVGTPEYMSPEQANSAGLDVDTRTDVYSLGVVLYEMLVGELPLQMDRLDQFSSKLRESDIPRPSVKLGIMGARSSVSANNRGIEIPALVRQLRGDLDAIALKALEKNRSRRYGTPSELAADIGRYLRNELVLAQTPSFAYRSGKYIRRHRVALSVAAGVAFLALTLATVQTIQLRRITRERDRANRITEFMTEMFRLSDPSQARGNAVTAREILDKASKEIESGLQADPLLQAQLMDVMGTVYESLGLYSRAQSLLEASVRTRSRLLGPKDVATAESLNHEANVLNDEGHFIESEKLDREALEIFRQKLGLEHPSTVRVLNNLANALQGQGRFSEAEKIQREVLAAERRRGGPESPEVLKTLNNLANTLHFQHRNDEAEKISREGHAIRRRILGPEHPETLMMLSNLGLILTDEHRYQDAAQVFREALAGQLHILGPSHPKTLLTMNNLAVALLYEGKYSQAEQMLREVLATQIKVLGPDNHETAMSRYNLGCIAALEGHRSEALGFLRDAIDHGLAQRFYSLLETDETLNSLHGDPKFTSLIAHVRQKAATH